MKKLIVALLAGSLSLPLLAATPLTQETKQEEKKEEKAKAKKKKKAEKKTEEKKAEAPK